MTDPRLFASLPTAEFLTQLRRTHATSTEQQRLFSEDAQRAPGNRRKPVVVLDTNVLLDMWYWNDPAAAPLVEALYADRFWAVRSDDTVDELADVLRRPRFSLSIVKQCEILRLWHSTSVGITLAPSAPGVFCRDPDDVKFLQLARSLAADLLITKDKKVLKAGRRLRSTGTVVLTPLDLMRPKAAAFAKFFVLRR